MPSIRALSQGGLLLALLFVTPIVVTGCDKKKEDAKEDKSGDDEKTAKKKDKKAGDDDDDDDKGSKKKKKKTGDDDDEKDSKKKGDDDTTKAGADGKCPSAFNLLKDHDKDDPITCTCNEDNIGGAVWGTDTYTEDSSPCAAAVHVGVIKKTGGSITVKHAKGCDGYTGTTRNEISSTGWGKFDNSFYFPSKTDGACFKSVACPAVFKGVAVAITCSCASGTGGSVWGNGTYTQDSSICRAALHAGVISATGGTLTARTAPGCKSYDGSTQNGVTTSGWGEFDSSFYFPAKSSGICKVPKDVAGAAWKSGEAVDCLWNGTWWQANVMAIGAGPTYKVHYVGYNDSWDEWVPPARLRARSTSSKIGTSAGLAPSSTVSPLPIGSTVSAGTAAPAAGAWKVGDACSVLWNGSWYPAHVIGAGNGTYKVHYDGYAASWDEWVTPPRMKKK